MTRIRHGVSGECPRVLKGKFWCRGFGVQLAEEEVAEEKDQEVIPAQRRQEGAASSKEEAAALLRVGKGRAPRKNPARPEDPARLCYQSREADPSS